MTNISKTAWIKQAAETLRQRFDDPAYFERLCDAVERIHSRQTAQEQNEGSTREDNNKGWSAMHAKFMTDMAEKLAKWRAGKTNYRRPWTPGQQAAVQRTMKRYATQLATLAWENKQRQPVAV